MSLPRRAVTRTARLASLPLGVAGRATIGAGRRLGGAPAEAVVAELQQRTADQLFRVLGELKGGAMKFGQAMSVMEAALPEEIVAPYRATLTKLQDAAPPMPVTIVHRVLERELGPDWRDRFRHLDDKPAASASIGQVHKGIWEDGREVAVKVQYPGAGDALRSDLRQIARVAKLIGGWIPGLEVKPLVEELQERMDEELDYRLEAAAQQQFADAFADDRDFVVPRVLGFGRQVLVTEWVDNDYSLARLIAEGSREDRDRFGELYARFLFSGPERVGLLHADPHPGNYRVTPDGRLLVVDYGAVARLPDGLPTDIGRLLRVAQQGDPDTVIEGLREQGFLRPHIEVDPHEMLDYLMPFVEPASQERFRFSRAWMREQFQRINDPRGPGFRLTMSLNLPPSYLLIHRTWLGGIGVLSQLNAEAPFRQILRDWMPGFADPDDKDG